MALTGVEIFKLLPKTNCKKCGFPTCLAFAMKLAQRQATLDACPDVSEEAKKLLGEASAPPVRPVTFGTGELAVKMGEETVLFRHEKRFVNPTVLALEIKDTEEETEVEGKIRAVLDSEINRVGQLLRIDAICITSESGDAGRLAALAEKVGGRAPGVPVMISTESVEAAEAAIKPFTGKKAIIYGVTEANAEKMAEIIKANAAIAGVKAEGLEALAVLTEKVKALGVEDMVLDSGARKGSEMLEHNTFIRRAAIKKGFKALGYPVLNFAQREDHQYEALVAGLGIAKYASIVVISSGEKWKNLSLFTLRQNIYTDPQVPMQVQQKIYRIGEPTAESPLLVTTNFSLTYFIVSGEVENAKVPAYLAVMDSEGLSVLTAWAAGKFTGSKIANFIKDSGIEKEISHRELIIPGYVAILSGTIEEKLPGWKVTVGPREANALPAFLKQKVA